MPHGMPRGMPHGIPFSEINMRQFGHASRQIGAV